MKILFLVFHGFSQSSGISKKIFNQVQGLRSLEHEVSIASYTVGPDNHRVRMIDDQILEDYGDDWLAPIKKRICYGKLAKYIIENKFKFVYIRSFHNANPFTIRFVLNLRKNGIKVVMEIPTYPYDQEYDEFPLFQKIELKIDQVFRRKLAKQLNAIVTFTDQNFIFEKKTICISNGIDFDQLVLKKTINDTSSAIHLIGVAEVHYWHGFDRLISGIGEYYRQPYSKEIYFHIIGGVASSEMNGSGKAPGFLEIIKKYNLEKYILFHGVKYGAELDDLFEKCDLAIGSLGRHRTGINKIKTLKNREYAARGIPFVYSEDDSDFEQMPYIFTIPADETPVNISEIVDFYHSTSWNSSKIRESVKELSWQKQMQKILKATFNE